MSILHLSLDYVAAECRSANELSEELNHFQHRNTDLIRRCSFGGIISKRGLSDPVTGDIRNDLLCPL